MIPSHCVMCRRQFRNGKVYLVGKPRSFWICRNCWKGYVVPLVCSSKGLQELLRDRRYLRSLPDGSDQVY